MTLFYIEFGSPTTRRCAPLKCSASTGDRHTTLSTVACPPVHRGEAARGTPPRVHTPECTCRESHLSPDTVVRTRGDALPLRHLPAEGLTYRRDP